MIKAVTKGDGVVATSFEGDFDTLMDEFGAIVSAMYQGLIRPDDAPPKEIVSTGLLGSFTSGLMSAIEEDTGMMDLEDEQDNLMDIIKEALKKEHEGE